MKKNSSLLVWFIHASPFILKTIILGWFGISLCAAYMFFTSDPPGYCGEQKRFLTEKEFIEIAVREEASRGMMKVDGSAASVSTFYAKHPNCCRTSVEPQSFIDRILNIYFVEAVMYYEVNDKELKARPKEGEYFESYLTINACGQVVQRFGMRTGKEYLPSGFN